MSETLSDNTLIQRVRILNMISLIQRNQLLKQWAKEEGISPKELLQKLSRYEVSRIRKLETGRLFHYHTIPTARLVDAQNEGALTSMEIQKAEGGSFTSSGSRPDVVQFTRDRYYTDGELLQCGVNKAIRASDEMSVLVFDPSIMDHPDYDITGEYPAMPLVLLNLGLVKACLNHNPEEAQLLFHRLAEENPGLIFVTPEEWVGNINNPNNIEA